MTDVSDELIKTVVIIIIILTCIIVTIFIVDALTGGNIIKFLVVGVLFDIPFGFIQMVLTQVGSTIPG